MIYKIENNTIKITDLTQFNISHILDCGQIFRYYIEGNLATVFSADKKAVIETSDDCVKIYAEDIDYFVDFFDLKTDYNVYKNSLKNYDFLHEPIKFGYGIRILKQNLFETLVSFIISANNNISRIKKSLFKICELFGSEMKGFYAFPTINQLKLASIDQLKEAGLGYRAEQLHKTLRMIDENMLTDFFNLTLPQKQNWLISLSGVGEKVADCILLFGGREKRIFPVDTWINKTYNRITDSIETNRSKIRKYFVEEFEELSGIAQQYFFYYYRSNPMTNRK